MPSTVIPGRTYNPGTLRTIAHTIGPAQNYLGVTTAAPDWSAGKNVTLLLEQSSDAGATWFTLLASVSPGPIAAADQQWVVALDPVPIGQTRQARATVTLAGGPITTPITLQTSPQPIA